MQTRELFGFEFFFFSFVVNFLTGLPIQVLLLNDIPFLLRPLRPIDRLF